MKYFLFVLVAFLPSMAFAQYDYSGDQDSYINKRFDNPYEDYGRADPYDDPYEDTAGYQNPFDKPEKGLYYEDKPAKEDKIKSYSPGTRNRYDYRNDNYQHGSISRIQQRGLETIGD